MMFRSRRARSDLAGASPDYLTGISPRCVMEVELRFVSTHIFMMDLSNFRERRLISSLVDNSMSKFCHDISSNSTVKVTEFGMLSKTLDL